MGEGWWWWCVVKGVTVVVHGQGGDSGDGWCHCHSW